ncbi:enoyl-CoA hydratase/isomerase family protein [Acetobacter fallax]|uniref:3-hydroxyisobutyryl-CoA hydrolase n=1 Tax=Acetobacter fallax TaxID=1737473 RepID=A0ABX0K9V0_9PROT|nr:enoyl-CoA hydratase/isomerase family protein [Acetobacter fallax]NHO31751.1 enoyl-CoA hydratase/isomerase family protein [Acetobacter fallax]NHO35310.1 enoyl-CoA hydratase/isomerase family protein [Acetobacter fallax]
MTESLQLGPSGGGRPFLLERRGSLARMTLDCPKKLNAVDAATAEEMLSVLDDWRDDSEVRMVLIDSSSPRAFCAGGDIKAIRSIIGQDGPVAAHTSMAIPYRTMLAIARYPKPVVTVMDGITMGGGIGFGAHARHRIVTERSVLAMPETAIGLTPDAGGGWLLARAPRPHGLRFALTGGRMNGAQAVTMGMADHLLHSDCLPSLMDTLADVSGEEIDAVLGNLAAARAGDVSLPGLLAASVPVYDALTLTPAEGLPLVLERLEAVIVAGGDVAWAEEDVATLKAACPFSLHVTWLMQQKLASMELITDGFSLESSAVGRLLARADFCEGVRARVIDKDNKPVWQPASIGGVDAEEVANCTA